MSTPGTSISPAPALAAPDSSLPEHALDLLVEGGRLRGSLRGHGTPLLLIHGVGVAGCGWRPQVDHFADRMACLSFDHRGVGESDPAHGPVSVESMARDALAFMDAVGWTSAHVVAHSLGGPVAMQLAHTARERVRSLALLCTFASGRAAAPMTPRMVWLGMCSQVGTRKGRRHAFLRLVSPPDHLLGSSVETAAERLGAVFGRDLAEPPAATRGQLQAMQAFDARPWLSQLAGIPTLVMSATHDPIAPPALGRELARAIAGAEFVELDRASHAVTIQAPERVNPLLESHLARAGAFTH